jgi:hypothetical protein
MMDSVKAHFPSNFGRCVFHSSYGAYTLIPLIFGETITNSNGRVIPTRSIAEMHILEDFGGKFIPTLQDWFEGCELKPWMCNGMGGTTPPSFQKIKQDEEVKIDPQDMVLDGARRGYDEFLAKGELKIPPLKKEDEYIVINPAEPNLDDLAPFIKFYPGVSD